MEIGKPFSNITAYNENLKKGMADKLFFLEHLPPGKYMFVDFGCGDGSMIDALADIFGNGNAYIGYDISEKK